MADNRKKSADERRYLAVVLEELFDLRELLLRDPDILSIFEQKRTTEIVRSVVVRIRATRLPIVPQRMTIAMFICPCCARYPAGGITISLGIGMTELSMAIRRKMRDSPEHR